MMFDRGWIICNTDIPIFPTLSTTRTDCIFEFTTEHMMRNPERCKDWHGYQSAWRQLKKGGGKYRCRRVELVFPDSDD